MDFEAHRDSQINDFLTAAGWADATLNWLSQDASSRRYARLRRGAETALLMDAPRVEDEPCAPNMTENERVAAGWNAMTRGAASRVDAFVAIADYLCEDGLSAPKIIAADTDQGFALIEDFGEGLEFARLIEHDPGLEVPLYTAAADVMAHLHRKPAPAEIQGWPILDYDTLALKANVDLFAAWLPQYDERFTMTPAIYTEWEKIRDELITLAIALPRNFILKDFHAENLLWLPERDGLAKVGLLDFQDAINGWDAWEIVMLIQDARRPVSAEAKQAVLQRYLDLTGKEEAPLLSRIAITGTLNALRITGLFARLPVRDGKMRYKAFMPRQQMLLAENLRHPATASMAAFVRQHAPFIFEAEA